MPLLDDAKARRSRELGALMVAYLVAAGVIVAIGVAGLTLQTPMLMFLSLAAAICLPLMGWHHVSQVMHRN